MPKTDFRERFKMKTRGASRRGGGAHARLGGLGSSHDPRDRHRVPALPASLRGTPLFLEDGGDVGQRSTLTTKSDDALDGGVLLVELDDDAAPLSIALGGACPPERGTAEAHALALEVAESGLRSLPDEVPFELGCTPAMTVKKNLPIAVLVSTVWPPRSTR